MTVKDMATSAMRPIRDIHERAPKRKLIGKYLQTGAGFLVFVGAFFMPKFLGIPHIAAYLVGGFGAWIMSKELVLGYIGVIPAALSAFKNGK